jgi:LysR family glycine cleavage system transcriptional activator
MFALIEQGVREVGERSTPCSSRRHLRDALAVAAPDGMAGLRPDVPVELTTTVQHGVDFRREGFDAAVVYGAAPNHGLQVRKLFDEQLTPVCAPSLLKGHCRCSSCRT